MILDSQICENIVIGGSTEAILYAYKNKYTLIMPYVEPLFPFQQAGDVTESEFRDRLLFLMGLDNLFPIPFPIGGVKIKNDCLLVAIVDRGTVVYRFNKLHLFDDRNVKGMPKMLDIKSRQRTIVDWFIVKKGMKHHLDTVKRRGIELLFFPTERFAGRADFKDVVAITKASKSKLADFDKSSTSVKLEIEAIMEKEGIENFEAEFAERQVIGFDLCTYEEDERILHLNNLTMEEIQQIPDKTSYCTMWEF